MGSAWHIKQKHKPKEEQLKRKKYFILIKKYNKHNKKMGQKEQQS